MDIKRSGSQPSQKGPAEHFTGSVRIDPLFHHIAIQESLNGKAVDWLEKSPTSNTTPGVPSRSDGS